MPVEQEFLEGIEVDPYDPLDVERAEVKTATLQEAVDMTIAQLLERRQLAYKRMWGAMLPEDREIIERDITWFCAGDRAVFHQDQRIHCLLTGRQEVYLRLMDHIKLNLEDFIHKYMSKPANIGE